MTTDSLLLWLLAPLEQQDHSALLHFANDIKTHGKEGRILGTLLDQAILAYDKTSGQETPFDPFKTGHFFTS